MIYHIIKSGYQKKKSSKQSNSVLILVRLRNDSMKEYHVINKYVMVSKHITEKKKKKKKKKNK
jgi:hypothetical protein